MVDLNRTYEKLVRHLKDRLLKSITGEDKERIIIEERLDDHYFIGMLSTQDVSERRRQSRARFKQIGIDFLINKDNIVNTTLSIKPHGFFYYRVFPTLEEQQNYFLLKYLSENPGLGLTSFQELKAYLEGKSSNNDFKCQVAPVFQKNILSYEPIKFVLKDEEDIFRLNQDTEKHLNGLKDSANSNPNFYHTIRDDVYLDDLENEESWQRFLNKNSKERIILNWDFDYSIEQRRYDEDKVKISFTWTNTCDKQSSNIKINDIFNARIELKVNGADLVPFQMKGFLTDYKYDTTVKAVGKNCFANLVSQEKNLIKTDTYPTWEQYKLKTRIRGKPAKFSELSKDPFPILESILTEMEGDYIKFDEMANLLLAEKKKKKTKDTIKQINKEKACFRYEIDRFKRGIDVLRKYEDSLYAFKLMNKSFIDKSKGFESWRLFQIVFIVSVIPDLIISEHPELRTRNSDAVDLLFFPTGGGKTEAFLGLIIFILFYERLQGKKFGVSSLVKYPLRLLSIQQIQRIADVVGRAELVRRAQKKIAESAPFSVGYLVGNRNTPNRIQKKEIEKLKNASIENLTMDYLLIDKCPFCGGKNVQIRFLEKQHRIAHFCPDCDEQELPIYIVDNEIYRYLPSVIISTIDKYALIGYQRNFRNIFGNIRGRCPLHGFTSQLDCTEKGYNGVCDIKREQIEKIENEYLSPRLLVQDELHLLSETLGIFNAHYETFIDYYLNNFVPDKGNLKIIAATATPSNYKEQIYHLYRKSAIRFPAPNPNLNKSFYYEIDENELNRLFIGIAPVGKTPEMAVLSLSQKLREIIWEYYNKPELLKKNLSLEISNSEIKKILRNYWVLLEYNQKKNETLSIYDTLDKVINPQLARPFEPETLTGDKDHEEVREIISKLEDEEKEFPEPDFIAATSMISHGVDVDIFNQMIFLGVPQNIGEYIQASSRVGRRFPALVFLVFVANREKDRSYFKYFPKFNEYKEILLEAIPINRWVNDAIDRTLPGLLSALLLLYYDYKIQEQYGHNIYLVGGFQHAVNKGWIPNSDELADILVKCYGADDEKMGCFYIDKIKKIVKDIYDGINNISGESKTFIVRAFEKVHSSFHPMMSLRDTDVQVEISLEDSNKKMSRGLIQSLYKHFPLSWLFFEKSKLSKVVAQVINWDSREVKDEEINKSRLLRRIEKHIKGFPIIKNIDRELDESKYVVMKPLRIGTKIQTKTYFCPNPGCKRAVKFSTDARHHEDYNNCPECGSRLNQMPLVYACSCGWTGPVELMGCPQHGDDFILFQDGNYRTRRWICNKNSHGKSFPVRLLCPECGQVLYPKNIGDSSISIARMDSMVDLIQSAKEKNLENPKAQDVIMAAWCGIVKNKKEEELLKCLAHDNLEMKEKIRIKIEELKKIVPSLKDEEARKIAENEAGYGDKSFEELCQIEKHISEKTSISEDNRKSHCVNILEYETIKSLDDKVDLNTVEEFSKKLTKDSKSVNHRILANEFGFKDVFVCSNIPMIFCSYGFSRITFGIPDSTLIGFPPDKEVKDNIQYKGKKNIYANKYYSEGIIFELDRVRIVNWLLKNKLINPKNENLPTDIKDNQHLKLWFLNRLNPELVNPYNQIDRETNRITFYINNLLHSMSHLILKNAASLCGLDKNSLSEYIFLTIPGFMIYCQNSEGFSLGSFFNLFGASFSTLLDLAYDSSMNCINDPICIQHLDKDSGEENAACFDCLFLNEISCQQMNYNLDRKLISGKVYSDKKRFFGYWEHWV